MILSAAANVTMGDNKMKTNKQTNKQNNPFDASSRRSVANRGGEIPKTSGESCRESEGELRCTERM